MKKLLYVLMTVGILFSISSCEEFLEQSSPSDADTEYIFQDAGTVFSALNSAFDVWRTSDQWIHSRGIFYDLSVCSSDAERHPEKYADQDRHIPENFYFEGTSGFNIDYYEATWNQAYEIIAICNKLITQMDAGDIVTEQKAAGAPDDISHIYGMAVAMRATIYYELTRYFGDVPLQTTSIEIDSTLSSRDKIYEFNIQQLEEVIPVMYRVGQSNYSSNKLMSRTYAEGLVGRLCLLAGGYATRRADLLQQGDFYVDLEGNPISFTAKGGEYSGGMYNRRTDYLDFYEIARTHLENLISDPGSAALLTADPRGTDAFGRQYGNPFQLIFQQMMDFQTSPELIYEIPQTYGEYSERPYAFGRPSNGGSGNQYPCKSYGQARIHPTFYYGDFDPQDGRRDVTVAVTASSGAGEEIPLNLRPGSKGIGGLALNKWDENRMDPPYTPSQRSSGVGNPYLRMSDVYLMLAEVYAELGQDAQAKDLLSQVRVRGFGGDAAAANVDGFISRMGGLKQAIWEERKLEFAGEGLRKWDMIRTGQIEESITRLKTRLTDMLNGLESDGYYTFENGNQISNYIWTKPVDAASNPDYGYRLTAQAPNEDDPVLYPGWRGQHDNWVSVADNFGHTRYRITEDFTNLAIEGLFEYIDPDGPVAAALEADGYEKTDWGIGYVEFKEEYSDYVFRGYRPGLAPIYMAPINSTSILGSEGKISNGYGFENPSLGE